MAEAPAGPGARNVEARLHVREDTSFYIGRRIGTEEIAEVLR